MNDDAQCGICGAAVVLTGRHLMHAEPWCKSWTYHVAVGDALPIRWTADVSG
jgi:hypothetical protein